MKSVVNMMCSAVIGFGVVIALTACTTPVAAGMQEKALDTVAIQSGNLQMVQSLGGSYEK